MVAESETTGIQVERNGNNFEKGMNNNEITTAITSEQAIAKHSSDMPLWDTSSLGYNSFGIQFFMGKGGGFGSTSPYRSCWP